MRTRNIKLNWVKIGAIGFGVALLICGSLVPVGAGILDIAAGFVVILLALIWRTPRWPWRFRFRLGDVFRSSGGEEKNWLR